MLEAGMGLMDKLRARANQFAQRTQVAVQEAAREGKSKLDQAQANRRADVLLRNLGAMIYAERTGRGGSDSGARVSALMAEIGAHEKEHGISLEYRPPSQFGTGDGARG
jgi:Tfp pilus assembly pilus retraction ATPase PilT